MTSNCWTSPLTLSSDLSSHTRGIVPRGDAVVRALAYGDVFDFPLTAREVHRYLDVSATAEEVMADLAALVEGGSVESDGSLYWLAGRGGLSDIRRNRGLVSAALWPHALHYGRVLASLPFVRMVAVTGGLAVDNVADHADVDYLVVTEPGRLWLGRGFVIGVVRLAGRRELELCPNYLVSENSLSLDDRDLFTAHELAQMVPLHGLDVYWTMRERNGWSARFLPNADGLPRTVATSAASGAGLRRAAEAVLGGPVGRSLERWERTRKIRRFSRAGGGGEVRFTEDVCKGHFGGYHGRILARFEARLHELGIPAGVSGGPPP